MKTIEKKAVPKFFEKVLSGEKNFDVRLNRFRCKSGDTLVLREWNPTLKRYTGRSLKRKVTFVLKTKEIEKYWSKDEVKQFGFLVIGLEKLSRKI